MRVLGDLRGIVIANVRIQSRYQHQRVPQMFIDSLAVDRQAGDAVFDEAMTGIMNQSDRVQQVMNHYRLENIQFKVALRAGESNRRIVTHDLYGHHSHRFALRGIDLARHDR